MQKPCPACENGSLPGLLELAEIAAHIHLAPSLSASRAVREERLEICGSCNALREKVLCSYCGCFVTFRARPAQGFCPHPSGSRWKN